MGGGGGGGGGGGEEATGCKNGRSAKFQKQKLSLFVNLYIDPFRPILSPDSQSYQFSVKIFSPSALAGWLAGGGRGEQNIFFGPEPAVGRKV